VIARDERRDLAALHISSTDLPAATVLDSDALRVGQLVMAVGNPLGLVGAMTLGIIHAIAPAEGHGRGAWVQADVHLAPGNSGGPLADAGGRVAGINSMVAGRLGLAVPSNVVQGFLGTGRARLGATLQTVLVPVDGRQIPGMLVLEVTPGSVAEHASLTIGDILIGVDGRTIESPGDLTAGLDALEVQGSIAVDLLRGGKRESRYLHGVEKRRAAA